MDKIYPFRDCDMELIKAIPFNNSPDYPLELLERINRDFEKSLEMAASKPFEYNYPNHTRLQRILWKMGFSSWYGLNDLVKQKRKKKQLQEQLEIDRKRLGVSENVKVSDIKQSGEWLYQEIKLI